MKEKVRREMLTTLFNKMNEFVKEYKRLTWDEFDENKLLPDIEKSIKQFIDEKIKIETEEPIERPIKYEDKLKIRDKLIEFENNPDTEGRATDGDFKSDKAYDFVARDPLAFVFVTILEQGWKSERVWETLPKLKKRLGHLDINKISKMNDEDLIKIFNHEPKIGRYPSKMALWIKNACKLIISKYQGNAENIWNDTPKSSDLQNRFEEFEGIGQKKASMATNMLIKDLGVKSKDTIGIDVSYDINVRRVFLRTGLVEYDNMNEILNIARALKPDHPGLLDQSAWMIGRGWCHSNNPNHDTCPLKEVCPKLNKNVKD